MRRILTVLATTIALTAQPARILKNVNGARIADQIGYGQELAACVSRRPAAQPFGQAVRAGHTGSAIHGTATAAGAGSVISKRLAAAGGR